MINYIDFSFRYDSNLDFIDNEIDQIRLERDVCVFCHFHLNFYVLFSPQIKLSNYFSFLLIVCAES